MDDLLSVENLQVSFGERPAVKDIGFAIRTGETLCVVGESGSGKSVTSLAIMRLVEFGGGRIEDGRIRFRQKDGGAFDITAAAPDAMRGLRGNAIGMIFQEPMTSLNPVYTIGRQLTDGLRVHRKLSAAGAEARALEMLREVRIPEPERRLKQYPHELSGGMRQRIVIAMAMACEPRLLIADEPTTALDVTIQAEILSLINRLKRDNEMAVLFITHDMAVVAQMADRVVVMNQGRIVETGPVEEIFATPKKDYTRTLLAAAPRLGEMRGKAAPERFRGVGEGGQDAGAETRAAPEVLLEVRHLMTRFPVFGGVLRRRVAEVRAVEDVSFTLNAGETLALVGESGCGKSSCGRSVLRLTEPQSGEIILGGRDVRALDKADLRAAWRDMQMVFQDPFSTLNPYRRLSDQVAEPMRNFALARGSELTDRVAGLFERVRLPLDLSSRFPHELSGGQRQRVAIARALAVAPKLIVADEAVSALDVSVQAQVLNLLLELQETLGLSYIFISHDMAVVERIAHQVAVMFRGRIVERGPRAAVFEDPQHPYTRRLLSAVPVADPKARRFHEELSFEPVASPIFPVGHQAPPSVYDEVGPGHFILRE